MAGEIPKTVGGGCLRGLLIQLFAMGLSLGLLVVCSGLVAVAPVSPNTRLSLALVALLGWVLTCLVGVLVFVVVNRRRIANEVDAAFSVLGLRGESQMAIGRQYHGVWQGRKIHAYFQKGPIFEIYLDARSGTRVAMAPGDALVRLIQDATGTTRFDLHDPGLVGVSVSADEAPWARALLADPAARDAVADLLDRRGAQGAPAVSVERGAVRWMFRSVTIGAVDGETVKRAANALVRLAERVEAADKPVAWTEPTSWELRLRESRPGGQVVWWVVIGTMVFCGVMSVVSAAVVMVLL